MTVRDVDGEYPFDDPDDGWFGRAIVVEEEPQDETREEPPDAQSTALVEDPAPVHATTPVDDTALIDADDTVDTDSWYMPVADPGSSTYAVTLPEDPAEDTTDTVDTDTDTWYVPGADPTSTEYAAAPPADPEYVPQVQQTTAEVGTTPRPNSWDSALLGSGSWDFASSSPANPSHRSQYVAAAVVTAVAVALVGAVLVIRTPGPTADDATPVTRSQTAQPAPSSAAPALSAKAPEPLPPPGPPPPPPPPPVAEEPSPPPVVTRQYAPSQQTPDDPQKPQINVTRAPMSATPPPPPTQDRNSATPGDSPKRRGFFR